MCVMGGKQYSSKKDRNTMLCQLVPRFPCFDITLLSVQESIRYLTLLDFHQKNQLWHLIFYTISEANLTTPDLVVKVKLNRI